MSGHAEPEDPSNHDLSIAKPLPYWNLVADLGDVFCFYDTKQLALAITPDQLTQILASPLYQSYEKGQIPHDECFAEIERQFDMPEGEATRIRDTIRASIMWNVGLVSFIQHLKEACEGQLQVFLMSNISFPDLEYVMPIIREWNLFDRIFASSHVNARKSEAGFWRDVMRYGGIENQPTVFLDNDGANVDSAREVGMYGIVFEDNEQTIRELTGLFTRDGGKGEEEMVGEKEGDGRLLSDRDFSTAANQISILS